MVGVTTGPTDIPGDRLYVYVIRGGLAVSREANFFHPYESASFCARTTNANVEVGPYSDHRRTMLVASMFTHPSAHADEYPVVCDDTVTYVPFIVG